MQRKSKKILNSFEKLLRSENSALRKGHLQSIDRLQAQKEVILKNLDSSFVIDDGSNIEIVRELAQKNHRLLRAAALGLRTVIDRIEETKQGSLHLRTYTVSGDRTELARPASRMKHHV